MSKRKHPRRRKKKKLAPAAPVVSSTVLDVAPTETTIPRPVSLSTIRSRFHLINERRAANG